MSDQDQDMGPFADMDPALVQAISRYGTPPYRQMVDVLVRDVGNSGFEDLPQSPVEMIEWIQAAINETPEQHRADLKFCLNWEAGYYDSGDSADLKIWYSRRETDDEMRERVGRGISSVRNSQEAERRQYLALKAKFERNA